jgi:hypothetical protein
MTWGHVHHPMPSACSSADRLARRVAMDERAATTYSIDESFSFKDVQRAEIIPRRQGCEHRDRASQGSVC